jgi:hypothetical protein
MTKQEKAIRAVIDLEKRIGDINEVTQRDVLNEDPTLPAQQAWVALRYIQLYKEIQSN